MSAPLPTLAGHRSGTRKRHRRIEFEPAEFRRLYLDVFNGPWPKSADEVDELVPVALPFESMTKEVIESDRNTVQSFIDGVVDRFHQLQHIDPDLALGLESAETFFEMFIAGGTGLINDFPGVEDKPVACSFVGCRADQLNFMTDLLFAIFNRHPSIKNLCHPCLQKIVSSLPNLTEVEQNRICSVFARIFLKDKRFFAEQPDRSLFFLEPLCRETLVVNNLSVRIFKRLLSTIAQLSEPKDAIALLSTHRFHERLFHTYDFMDPEHRSFEAFKEEFETDLPWFVQLARDVRAAAHISKCREKILKIVSEDESTSIAQRNEELIARIPEILSDKDESGGWDSQRRLIFLLDIWITPLLEFTGMLTQEINKFVGRWAPTMRFLINKEYSLQGVLIVHVQKTCHKHPQFMDGFHVFMRALYEKEVIEEEAVRAWHMLMKSGTCDQFPGARLFTQKMTDFIAWLDQAPVVEKKVEEKAQ